jgi:hypothetical protein
VEGVTWPCDILAFMRVWCFWSLLDCVLVRLGAWCFRLFLVYTMPFTGVRVCVERTAWANERHAYIRIL